MEDQGSAEPTSINTGIGSFENFNRPNGIEINVFNGGFATAVGEGNVLVISSDLFCGKSGTRAYATHGDFVGVQGSRLHKNARYLIEERGHQRGIAGTYFF